MKIQFESNQHYQIEAVQAVVSLFKGQPLAHNDFELLTPIQHPGITLNEKGLGNNLLISHQQILNNLKTVQAKNNLSVSNKLIDSTTSDHLVKLNSLNFTVEMETGTGKTYTFIRTIYELNKVYGFKKFVIVVPSVAIREGTKKNLEITHTHFQELYNHTPLHYSLYDSTNLTELRNFATSNSLQILVINIDSFTKDANIINSINETGLKPMEYIQATQPIVIVDEPQNFETDIRKQAIAALNPLCTLRYSATHRNLYNLVYSLNPVMAHELGLVKQIEVDGITSDNLYNGAFIWFRAIVSGKTALKAKITIYVNDGNGIKTKDMTANLGDDLYTLSNYRHTYQNGYIITNINAEEGTIQFANNTRLSVGQTFGGMTDEIIKYQIENTVKWHFEKIRNLQNRDIKVLSLFFIDRVENYRKYDPDGHSTPGKFALWFEDAFNKFQNQYGGLIPFNAQEVHNGYFAIDKIKMGKHKQEVWVDSKEKNTQKDNATYALIMQNKEQLLNLNEPLQFIFSHSALREGWDNPNVFQICTLNESKSDLKKRQEIGRGLRLPVDAHGRRLLDKTVNVLTVVANETYEDFSKALQQEMKQETGTNFNKCIKSVSEKVTVKLNHEINIENFPNLVEALKLLNQSNRFTVSYSTDELIRLSVDEIKKLPVISAPAIQSKTGKLKFANNRIESEFKGTSALTASEIKYTIPDVYSYIQNKVDITRKTLYLILTQSNRLHELELNPQLYLDNITGCIKKTVNQLMVKNLTYTRITEIKTTDTLLKSNDYDAYETNLYKVKNASKSLFNYLPINHDYERTFVQSCDDDPNVKLFIKFPDDLKILTPVGNLIPGWLVLFKNEKMPVYIVETHGTLNFEQLTDREKLKFECGTKFFASIGNQNIKYQLANTSNDLY